MTTLEVKTLTAESGAHRGHAGASTLWAGSAPWSALSKSGLLSERERLPCRCLVFVLLPAGCRGQGGTFHDQLERITDVAQLRGLHELAIRARRVSQFRTALAALAP